jgi:hypothetical protein
MECSQLRVVGRRSDPPMDRATALGRRSCLDHGGKQRMGKSNRPVIEFDEAGADHRIDPGVELGSGVCDSSQVGERGPGQA